MTENGNNVRCVYGESSPLRVFTTFSGYDSQCLALDRIVGEHGFAYDLVGWSEVDKYAIMAHDALFPQYAGRNYGDISRIDWSAVPDFDLLTYSSPCQDFSQAGLQRGGDEGSGTRSSLLWEVKRAITEKRPRYLLLENVAALAGKKFAGVFMAWQEWLAGMGYTNYARVLNSKDYGVPQNRKRVFLVSVRDGGDAFRFPDPIPLGTTVDDILEDSVDGRYYLTGEKVRGIVEHCDIARLEAIGFSFSGDPGDGTARRAYLGWSRGNPIDNTVRYPVELANTLTTFQGWGAYYNAAPYIMEQGGQGPRTVLGWSRDAKGNIRDYHPVKGGVFNCVTASPRDNTMQYIMEDGRDAGIRVRKITEREAFRLMGLTDSEVDRIQAYRYKGPAGILPDMAGNPVLNVASGSPWKMKTGEQISRTQQSKMAGNSIVVDVLVHIFRSLLVSGGKSAGEQLSLF